MAELEYTNKGYNILGRNVKYTVEGSNVSVRIDLVLEKGGQTYFLELKNGVNAGFTKNQMINYDLIIKGAKVKIIGLPSMINNSSQPVNFILQ